MTCTLPETTLPGIGDNMKILVGKGVFVGPACVGIPVGIIAVGKIDVAGTGRLNVGIGVDVTSPTCEIGVGDGVKSGVDSVGAGVIVCSSGASGDLPRLHAVMNTAIRLRKNRWRSNFVDVHGNLTFMRESL